MIWVRIGWEEVIKPTAMHCPNELRSVGTMALVSILVLGVDRQVYAELKGSSTHFKE